MLPRRSMATMKRRCKKRSPSRSRQALADAAADARRRFSGPDFRRGRRDFVSVANPRGPPRSARPARTSGNSTPPTRPPRPRGRRRREAHLDETSCARRRHGHERNFGKPSKRKRLNVSSSATPKARGQRAATAAGSATAARRRQSARAAAIAELSGTFGSRKHRQDPYGREA